MIVKENGIASRPDFELFKSNICHSLKELGDIQFLIEKVKSDEVNDVPLESEKSFGKK